MNVSSAGTRLFTSNTDRLAPSGLCRSGKRVGYAEIETEKRVLKYTVNFQPDDRKTTIPSDEKPIDYSCGL